MPARARIASFFFLALFAFLSSGCAGIHYVTQASKGQYDLMTRARDIDELVQGEHVTGRTKELLTSVARIKTFGERYGLKPTPNYRTYVRLDRNAVVWVVSASDPLRFRSKVWSFPFVGSFTYLGWFDKTEAEDQGNLLREKGWDVNVRGSVAYSTAGYFEDAVLSSMFADGPRAFGDLANTILHESAHATIFVHHQSSLNESIANFIGDRLAERYLVDRYGEGGKPTLAYRAAETDGLKRGARMNQAYLDLDALYKSSRSREEKLAQKASILAALKKDLRLAKEPNNASLIQYKTYHSGQEEMARLLETCGGEWPRFLKLLESLQSATFEQAQDPEVAKIVEKVIAKGCP